ncbi:MAG: hypothetical protein E2O39_00225 [Planctomycetota bacterium]|nr:MAG: hypothetical protein E2O39_00225 [Planctomycetota bacterium]
MTYLPLLLIVTSLQAGELPDEPIGITATLDATSLEVGVEYEIILELYPGEASTSAAGIPAPFLQIDVPPSVKLSGPVLETYAELSRNEFLQEPYERLLKQFPARIGFRLIAPPGPEETIGLNIVAYLEGPDGEKTFLRRRLELPLTPGAEAVVGDEHDSSWGTDEKLLQIGDRAALFELPRADGTMVALASYLGEKNIIITTYRAFW